MEGFVEHGGNQRRQLMLNGMLRPLVTQKTRNGKVKVESS